MQDAELDARMEAFYAEVRACPMCQISLKGERRPPTYCATHAYYLEPKVVYDGPMKDFPAWWAAQQNDGGEV